MLNNTPPLIAIWPKVDHGRTHIEWSDELQTFFGDSWDTPLQKSNDDIYHQTYVSHFSTLGHFENIGKSPDFLEYFCTQIFHFSP